MKPFLQSDDGRGTGRFSRRAYDVFNGDADGICALHQLRLAYPKDATLVTGVKRDVALLERIPLESDLDVAVLDISLDANVISLRQILNAGGEVMYFDHHSAEHMFAHSQLGLFWDDSSDVCTSILVDGQLRGRFRAWSAVGAFGDNLPGMGRLIAGKAYRSETKTNALEMLGVVLNYNAYGERVEDLHIRPDALYTALHEFVDPLDFIAAAPEYQLLINGYHEDEARIGNLQPAWEAQCGAIYMLPATAWARRVTGVFANKLVSRADYRSYAVLTEKADGSYVASVRSGQPKIISANGLCEKFPSGGGRKAAAGINTLPANELDRFADAFFHHFSLANKRENHI
jgi:hypothetical protein